MATTYELIAKNVLGSTSATVTFTSIPQTFDDLCLLISPRSSHGGSDTYLYMKLNGNNTTSNPRYLVGSGSVVSSGTALANFMGWINASAYSGIWSSVEIYIPNYAGSANKSVSATCVSERPTTTAFMSAHAGIYGSSAVTSIEFSANDGSFVAGSSFYLYGITKA